MPITVELIQTLLSNQRKLVTYHLIMAGMIIIVGSGIIVTSFTLSSNLSDNIQLILEVGGGFISTISAFSIGKVINSKNKINTLTMFINNYEGFDENELMRIDEYFWNSVK